VELSICLPSLASSGPWLHDRGSHRETIVPVTAVADPPATASRQGPKAKGKPKPLVDVPDIKLQVIPLGGFGEFGMTCMVIC
jgi:hypothetical protein